MRFWSAPACPRPAGVAGLPSGRAQSTGTSHQHLLMWDRPGPAATTRWPLPSEQHSACPPTDQARLDVLDQPKKAAPQAVWRCMTHYGSTLRHDDSGHRDSATGTNYPAAVYKSFPDNRGTYGCGA